MAEDLVSQVFLDVWRTASQFEGRSQVSTWLLSIARFKALTALRQRKHEDIDQDDVLEIADETDTPEASLDRSNTSAILRACVAKLSPAHREIINLVYYHAARHLRGFTTAWNVLAGYPLLVPACFAVGVHAAHHRPSTYGTAADPEYLPFGRSRTLIVRFLVLNLAFPWLMALRFIVAGPLALLVPPLQRKLESEATSLAMNSAYRRDVDLSEHRTIVRQQLGLLVLWIPVGVLLWRSVVPARALAVWAVVASGIALVNGIRTLAAHKYEGNGSVLDREAQWADSIDTPGAWWTTIWAPVGHRYHVATDGSALARRERGR